MAATLDGRAADRYGGSKYLTCEASLKRVHRMRDHADAVLVGGRTLELDDPLLTVRRVRGRDPLRVVVDPMLRHARPGQRIFHEGGSPVVLCVSERLAASARSPLAVTGARFLELPCGADGQLRPRDLLAGLLAMDVHHLLVEGGPRTAAAFLEAGVVDRAHFVYAPRLMLDREAAPVLASAQPRRIDAPFRLTDLRVRRVGADLWVEGSPQS